jgi:nitroreductase
MNRFQSLGGLKFMEVIDALNSRFTCRAFKQDPIKEETILKIMDAATRSPSWANTQPWEIFAAGGDVLERIRRAYMEYFANEEPVNPDVPLADNWPAEHEKRMKELGIKRYQHLGISREDKHARNASWRLNFKLFGAPVVVYLCMDQSLREWSMFDLGSVSQSIMLAAQEYGVDSAPAVNLVVYPELIRKEIEIPKEMSIVMGIALGIKDNESQQNTFRSSRRSIENVVYLKGF